MKRILITIVLAAVLPAILSAQDYPKAEVYGGYTMLRETAEDAQTFQGFIGAIEANISKSFGIVGEFGMGMKSFNVEEGIDQDMKQSTFLAGPRFSFRTHRLRVFTQILAGVNHISGGVNGTASSGINAFTFGVGAGLDFSICKRISIRPVQIDYLASRMNIEGATGWMKNLRYSGGLVIKFGAKN
jgi:hypothetical protein